MFFLVIVDGVWNPWTEWTSCTTICGYGTTHRNRTCVEPQYGGEPCGGEYAEIKDCNTQPCPSRL